MAMVKLEAYRVLQLARRAIIQIDHDNAVAMNKYLDEQIQKKKLFSKEPKWKSYTEIIDQLTPFEYSRTIGEKFVEQKFRCEDLAHFCKTILAAHFTEILLSAEDMRNLGFFYRDQKDYLFESAHPIHDK